MQTIRANTSIAALLGGFFTLFSAGSASAEPVDQAWRCTSEGHAREIALNQRGGARLEGEFACWVVYAKDGDSKVLWQARNEEDYCEPRALALLEKLQAAGFECNKVTLEGGASFEEPAARPAAPESAEPAAADGMGPPVDGQQNPNLRSAAPAAQAPTGPDRVGGGAVAPGESAADLRALLARHYDGNYLDAMLAAMPGGLAVRSGKDAISPGAAAFLRIGPPNHFIKTLPDGSYVLVNTMPLESGKTSSYVNFGFQVKEKRYRLLGYASTRPVTEFKVLDADTDGIVLSLKPVAVADCTPARRTQVIPWHSEVPRHAAGAGAAEGRECLDPQP